MAIMLRCSSWALALCAGVRIGRKKYADIVRVASRLSRENLTAFSC
jgi:hypothetical protein